MTPGTGSAQTTRSTPPATSPPPRPARPAPTTRPGELTSSALSGTTTSYTYNTDGQRLTAKQGSTTIVSDSWNGADELTSYSNQSANMASATYSGSSPRAMTTITPVGGTAITQSYLWSGNNLLMDSTNAYIYVKGVAPTEQVNLSTGLLTYVISDPLGRFAAS